MKQRHRLAPAAEDAFRILGMTEQLEFRMAAAERLNQLLLAIASVSLLVGGVGIMNVMLISVTERTREIGLRRAMGARRRDVLAQILVEAAALSVIGGAIGVLIAFAASSALSALAGMPITLDVGIGAFALLFSGGIGVAFGFYPAWRASVQEPIEALRHE
jgi:putative ABC transport system permease protein